MDHDVFMRVTEAMFFVGTLAVTIPAVRVGWSMRDYAEQAKSIHAPSKRRPGDEGGEADEFLGAYEQLEPILLSKILGWNRIDYVLLCLGLALLLLSSGLRLFLGG
jgi:hypothetical protein